jgi:hypothetical protein
VAPLELPVVGHPLDVLAVNEITLARDHASAVAQARVGTSVSSVHANIMHADDRDVNLGPTMRKLFLTETASSGAQARSWIRDLEHRASASSRSPSPGEPGGWNPPSGALPRIPRDRPNRPPGELVRATGHCASASSRSPSPGGPGGWNPPGRSVRAWDLLPGESGGGAPG